MKIIKELALLLILIAISRVNYTNGQLITKNTLKKDSPKSKEILNESALKHKRDYITEKFPNAHKSKEKRSLILSSSNIFLEINQLKNNFENKSPICSITNCFMPHGVCVEENVCKCSKYFGNLFMIDLIEKIKTNNIENFISVLLSQNEISFYFSDYFKKFYSEIFCGYHKKSQIIAFFLESIFLIGIGHFYLNRFFHGLFKLLLILFIILLVFSMKKSKIEIKFFMSITADKLSFDFFLNFMYFILVVNFIFIHLVDVIMIASNQYKDGFGFSMLSWNSHYNNH